ncbi:hypothetical protein BCR43DRAFT_491374 [Syncephalastrum racemosum]|uniref:DUF676 domain-containing protein n=1 Tax=Syncephalastrum racemosum TaxID=13706 RepID=A0A1X2HBT7_SYNRA|nr:hypothetical protein BCR43DRAFT_491374 [Syncephalastrum racemosum]
MAETEKKPKELLLLVFIHGFRGSDTTFKDFPNRLKTVSPFKNVETVIYPRYKTAGDFSLAVRNLVDWLKEQVKQRESAAETIEIVLLGHSMGGLVSGEAILEVQRRGSSALGNAALLGLVAYDTPFYSVNHRFVSTTALSHAEVLTRNINRFWPNNSTAASATARSVAAEPKQIGWTGSGASSSTVTPTTTKKSSFGWGMLAGVAGVAAAGAVAYMAKDKISSSVTDVYDHLEFVSTLMDFEGCRERVRKLAALPDVYFKCFYAQLPREDNISTDPRTFIALPPPETAHLFVPVPSNAENEIDAHTSMFHPLKNEHYYTLGLDTMSIISEMVARHRRRT